MADGGTEKMIPSPPPGGAARVTGCRPDELTNLYGDVSQQELERHSPVCERKFVSYWFATLYLDQLVVQQKN